MRHPLGTSIRRLLILSHGHRFSILLVTLFVLLVTAPMLGVIGFGERVAYATVSTVFVFVLMAALFALARTRGLIVMGLAVLVPVVVMSIMAIIAAIALTMRRRKAIKYQRPSSQVSVRREERVRIVKMPAEKKQ